MKKTKLSLVVSTLVIATSLIVVSCQKKATTTTPTPDTSTTSTTDNNMAQQNAHDITNFGSEGIENDNGSLSSYKLAQGGSVFNPMSGSVNVNINTSTKTMDVVFVSYVGYDGHLRNGLVHYDWSNSTAGAVWYRDSGMVLNITTPGNTYSVDNYTVQVNNKQIKNIGRVNVGGNTQLTWTDVSNITILKPSSAGGGTIQWQGNWSIALLNTNAYTSIAADGTTNSTTYPAVFHGYGGTLSNYINWNQALVSVSGTFGGTASDGETYTGNISTPLVLNFNCTPTWSKYLYVSGVLNFTPTGKTTRTINYGAGTCDLTYVVSIGSFSLTITI
ncbi:MAG: hypothetical protein ABI388_12355 [Bacteroidia bacterium]